MAIDPEIYKKYNGKSGDPQKKLGQVLSKQVAHEASREERAAWQSVNWYFQWRFLSSIVVGIVILIALAVRACQGKGL